MNFALMKHHQFQLHDLDDMLPYERSIYAILLKQWIDEENRRRKEQQGASH